jgi:tRNA G10  N-methylase Trm11
MKTLITADSLVWLSKQKQLSNVITGIPDLDETPFTLEEYLDFFKKIVALIFKKLDKNGYAIFVQTDRKYNKTWIDKSAIITEISQKFGLKIIWHKIVLNRLPGKIDLYRPTYSHMLCYSYSNTTGAAFCDVIPISKRLYKNGTPLLPAKLAVEFIKKYNPECIVDPFIGRGTIAAIAVHYGLDCIGIDIDPDQIRYSQDIIITDELIQL